ncbi:MAG TPA: GNAT family N-acetyltransferase, partial [Treponemataceae bacterium]|nr:GNAT family N-acetyltransferase [Treponemataceae bacterium]
MAMNCEIKRLSMADVSAIKELFVGVFANEPWNDDWSDEAQLMRYLEDIAGNNNSLSLGLYAEGALCGIALGSIIHWYTGTEYYIREFCVRRDSQGSGLGSLFMGKIEDFLKSDGIFSIILSTDVDTPAHGFYLKNGFGELPKARFFHKGLK